MTKNRDISKILDQNTTFTATLSVGSGTANLFTNSTIIKLANSTVNTSIVVPTSAQYTGSYFLHANGTWQLAGGLPGGSDTYVQFNDGGASLNGTAGFTFNKGTNNAVIANTLTVGTATINSTNYSQTANNATWHGTSVFANSTGAYPTSNSVGAVIGNTISRVIITGNSASFISTLAAGDTTVTGFVNATTVVNSAAHTIGTTLIANTLGVYHTGIVNAASHTTTGFLANATHVVPTSNSSGQTFGNTISRWVMTANSLTVSGGASPDSNTLGTALGTTTQRWVALANTVTVSGGVSPDSNTLGTALGTTTQRWVVTGNSATFSSTLAAGDTTITGFVNATVSVNSAAHTIGSTFIANTLGAYHTGTINAASHTTTGFLANATHVVPTSNSSGQTLGNTISRWVLTANSVTTSGGVSPDSNTLGTALGTTTQRWVLLANTIESTGLANVNALNVVNQTNTATLFATTSAAVGANVVANTTAVLVGNSTYFVNHTSQAITLANSTVNTALTIPTSGQYSATNYFLHANGSWVQVTAGGGGAVHVYQAYSATGGQTTFTVSGGYTINQIDVYENGIHLSNTEYTQDGSTVVLASAALAGEIIEVSGWQSMATFTPVASGANTQVQFNDSTLFGGSAGFTFDKATNNAVLANTVTVGSSTVNAVANSLAFTLANSTVTYSMSKPTAAQVSAANYYLAADSTWKQIAATPPGGSDTYVQYNDAGVLGGLAGFTYNKTTNNVFIANTLTVGSATINSTNYSQTANNANWLGGNISANSTGAYPVSNTSGAVLGNTISRFIITGNSATFSSTLAATDTTITGFVNATVSVNSAAHTIGSTFIANTLGVYHTGTINAASHTTTGFLANATHVVPTSNSSGQTLGNTISRWVLTANSVTTSGGVSPDSNTLGTALGTATQRWVLLANTIESTGLANVNALNVTAAVNTATLFATTSVAVGANALINATTIIVGNSIVNTMIGNNIVDVGNSTVNIVANSTILKVANATANSLITPASYFTGNSIANLNPNSIQITLANATTNVVITPISVFIGNSVANIVANSISIDISNATANVIIDPVNFFSGNSVANLNANSIALKIANATANSILTPVSLFAGNSTVNNTINSVSMAINISATANLTANSTIVQVANSTGIANLIPNALTVNTVSMTGSTGLLTVGGGGIKTFVGNSTVAPLTFQSGTNLTTAAAGAVEFDGVQVYNTIDTTSGRAAIPAEQYFHLTADGGTIGTIANFFGTTSNISLVSGAHYIIDIYCFFLNTTAGTVTWTFTNSVAPTSQSILARLSPITGVVAAPGGTAERWGHVVSDATAARTYVDSGSLTDAVNHFAHFKISLVNSTGTNLKIQATKLVGGTITPRRNSWWFARRMSPSNIGTFAA